jgi:PiT family inorganic phosphate transporter
LPATVIQLASHFGLPVSTTHVISGSIMGVGASRRLSAVRWGVAGNMFVAWVLTIPACAAMAWLVFEAFLVVGGLLGMVSQAFASM